MTQDFQKPFAAPPTIFMIALVVAIVVGLLFPWAYLSWTLQVTIGPFIVLIGVYTIYRSIKEIEAGDTTYDPYAASDALVTSGIYQYSRNPGYLGLAIIQLGMAVLIDNVWIVLAGVIAIWITNRFVIKLEEQKLKDTFGETYRAYTESVRRWI